MASQVEEAKCVLWFYESRSTVTLQRRFPAVFGREPLTKMSIYKWYKLFDQNVYVCKGKSTRRRQVSGAQMDTVRAAFVRSPRKSISRGARQLNMPHTTVHTILRKHLKFKICKYQLLQHVTAQNKQVRYIPYSELLWRLEGDEIFTAKIVRNDEATLNLSGNVNRHNLKIWGTNNPHEVTEHTRDSPKFNVFCTLSQQNVFGPFFLCRTYCDWHK
jgi:hypothetical protein